jgi:hypothetical protein
MRGDLLRQVFDVRVARVDVRHLEHEPPMAIEQRREFGRGFQGHVGGLLHGLCRHDSRQEPGCHTRVC